MTEHLRDKTNYYFTEGGEKYRVRCNECGSSELLQIVYGYPSEEYIEKSIKDEIILGGCTINDANLAYKCKDCGAEISSIDAFMCHFCDDAIEVLQNYDLQIRKKMLNGNNKNFYIYDAKGIGVYSITEPIIKFLIYTNLSDKYRMLSERTFYEDKKILDLALFYKHLSDDEIANLNVDWDPDIAIEMKWAGMMNDGNLYSGWLNQIKLDIEKMNKLISIENKYFMLFTLIQYVLFSRII
ncbi:MAG: hypothetical protein PHC44_05690 [Lutispora sp.]|nr:hypothetical protein [Lutispora sp.]MDD4834208.1 hypothetical protein [Lutispora sp.]